MIITRITLENYKQYRGEQTYQIGEDATIGVIGANGVGKTTIFEAIEWCLYKPSTIKNTDIRPRGSGGEVRVAVQLTTQSGNDVYEVERVLKRSTTQATVYKLNELGGGDPLVQGTREVTDYISTRLIGLGHAAFVATFFTRQKELGFFSNLGASDRRREVGKLLGFETIKQAQAIIAEDRTKARHDADTLQRRYDAQTSDRNLDQELVEISAIISGCIKHVAVAGNSVTAAERHLTDTEASNQVLQAQRDSDTALAAELRDHQSRRTSATERRDTINQDLARLDQQEEERTGLALLAAKLTELAERRTALESERGKFQRKQHAQKEITRLDSAIADRILELRTIVDNVAPDAGSRDWVWLNDDAIAPVQAIERLLSVVTAVDVPGAERHCGSMRQARTAADKVDQEQSRLDIYHKTRGTLQNQVASLTVEGDPGQLQRQAQARLNELREKASASNAEIKALTAQQDRSHLLIERLRLQHFEETCPTCGRPFNDDEANEVIATMREAVAQKNESIRSIRQAVKATSDEVEVASREMETLRQREKALDEVRTRIANSTEHIERQKADVQRLRTTLESALRELSLTNPPTGDEVEAADRELSRRRNIHQAIQPLQMTRRSIQDASQHHQQAEQELALLADVTWDPEQLRSVVKEHDAASRAVSAIEQIDRQLARRPQLQHDLDATTVIIASCKKAVAELQGQRDALGFDPAALQSSNEALKLARTQDREARDHLHAAEQTKRESEYRLESLRKEQRQIAELAKEADARRREHDELNLMYSEFSEFDRFVAQHVSPVLSDTTSDIVANMTDGRYDRVTFDEDYGIEVFDQSDEGFPLETFSGGERDAISLAARLALSRMIGQQAANPPGFLVLDEVFGSLDADRRERVLTLLGQQSTEYFRQMFIISHIDDVQQSPVFDTIWQVEEGSDGSSRVISSDSVLSDALNDT